MDIKHEAEQLFSYTRALRRDFHQHPELGFNEIRTAGVITRELTGMGYQVTTGLGKTGVVGVLKGPADGPTVLLRFDMDALPIQEENTTDYASLNPGVMHACGHDCHVSVGLTCARMFAAHLSDLKGTIKLVFQPSEETGNGALSMINDGALDGPLPDFALGLHVWNLKPVGWFGITEGPMMAGANRITFKITGSGGHGAQPYLTIDPMITATQIVTALQTVVSRNISPLDGAVLSITHMEGGSAFNVIPSTVSAEGTIRAFTPEVRQTIVNRFEEIVKGIASAMHCSAETAVDPGTHPVINDKKVAQKVTANARELFPDAIIENNYQTMGAEDMSEFLMRIPGCFFFIGSANQEKGLAFPHHHPCFDVDEDCLPLGVALLVKTTMDLLSSGLD